MNFQIFKLAHFQIDFHAPNNEPKVQVCDATEAQYLFFRPAHKHSLSWVNDIASYIV